MNTSRILLLFSMLLTSSVTWSAIQDQGDYLLDTETGFKWIKPTLTRGVSTDEGRDAMTPIGEYAGCRFPNDVEVSDLFVKLSLPAEYAGSVAPEDSEAFEAAIKLLGDTKDARLDETVSALDAAPGGAGFTRAGYLNGYAYGIFVSYSDIGPYHVYLRDGEYVDRISGVPVEDKNDEYYVKRNNPAWQPAADSTGLMMICENWPTLPIQPKLLDFENLPEGYTAPFTQKGYRVKGDATAIDQGGNIILATTECTDCDPSENFSTSQTITRADGGPFAFFDLDIIDLDHNFNPQGNCAAPGPRDLGYDRGLCTVQGVTTWGETVYHNFYPDPFADEHAYGMGVWLNLVSLTIPVLEVALPILNPQQMAIDNVRVKDSIILEVDFDPWSTADILDPTFNAPNAFVIVEINSTPGFDAATVNVDSLRLGPTRAKVSAAPLSGDYDQDGDTDYIFGFRTKDTGIRCIDSRMILEGQTNDGTPFAASIDFNVSDNCFETVTMDVQPFDAYNRLYPDDDYIILVQLHHSSVANGDPVDFDANRSVGDIRFGTNRAKNVLSPLLRAYPPGVDWEDIYGFEMQDSGIACGDTEVELVGLHNPSGYYSQDEPFPSGKPAFKATATIQADDCDTGGCHP